MPTLWLVKFSKFEPVLLTVPYLSINYSQIVPFFADPITYINGIYSKFLMLSNDRGIILKICNETNYVYSESMKSIFSSRLTTFKDNTFQVKCTIFKAYFSSVNGK